MHLCMIFASKMMIVHIMWVNHILVGGLNHREKYEFVNGNDYPIYNGKEKSCLKSPTSYSRFKHPNS